MTFGPFTYSTPPFYGRGAIQTHMGTHLPPGGQVVAYVRSTGVQDGDSQEMHDKMYPTLNGALALCRSGLGDIVIVLPEHVESVASADQMSNLVAGTQILGIAKAGRKPKLTWTTATSTFLLDVADVGIYNFELRLADSGNAGVTVAAPITISGARCMISGCDIAFGDDANDIVTVGITTTAAADDLHFIGNHCYGATAAECTTFMDLIGTDRLRMSGNYIQGATSNVAVGIVRFATTASLDIRLESNYYGNLKALSTCAVTGLAGVSGVSWQEHFHYLDTSSLTAWLTSAGLMSFHRPTVTNTAGETGSEVVGTVSA